MQWTWSGEPPPEGEPGILPVLLVRPGEALTNQEGLTRVFVSSPTGGTFEIKATSLSSTKNVLFEPITFAGAAPPR